MHLGGHNQTIAMTEEALLGLQSVLCLQGDEDVDTGQCPSPVEGRGVGTNRD